jgi:hypothetical protein
VFIIVVVVVVVVDGQSADNLLFRWHKVPVERPDNLSLPQFDLKRIDSFICDKSYVGSKCSQTLYQ